MAAIPLAAIPIPAGRPIGIFFLLIGLITGFSGFSAFRQAGTSLRPGDEPSRFVTQGPFRITRNPMYLGLELILIAAFFSDEISLFSHSSGGLFFLNEFSPGTV